MTQCKSKTTVTFVMPLTALVMALFWVIVGTQTAVTAQTVTSTHHGIRRCEGCTPGFWKTHTDTDKYPNAWPPTGYSPDDEVGDVFDIPGSYNPSIEDATLLEALAFHGGPSIDDAAQILLRISVASLLDAAHPHVSYHHSEAEIRHAVKWALETRDRRKILKLAGILDRYNNAGCSINGK